MRLRRLAVGATAVVAPVFGAGWLIGCCALSGGRHVGPSSDHFDGERFFTPGVAPPAGAGAFLEWQRERRQGPWSEHPDAGHGPPPPRRVEGGAMRVTFVNHATLLIQQDGVNVLTDPIWSERASPFSFAGPRRVRPPGIRLEDLPPIDAVVISHNHYDHMDVATLKRLRERFTRMRIFAGLGNRAFLESKGLDRVEELDWWQSATVGSVEIIGVPTRHFSNRGLCDRNTTLWLGYVVRGPAGMAYFAGDTGFGGHFAAVRERLGPVRLALLPIGAYKPEWFMAPVHVSPAEAVEAHLALGAKTSVGMHFGTFILADDGETEPVEALERAKKERGVDAFWVLGFGEGRNVP